MSYQNHPRAVSHFKEQPLGRAVKTVLAGALLTAASQAQAVSWQLDNGLNVDLDTQLAYAAQWRTEKQDTTLLDPATNGLLAINTDDGNRSFEDGDMTQNRFSFSSDLDIAYQDDGFDGGIFVRARGFYDDAYSGSSANHSAATCNRNVVAVPGTAIAPLSGLEQIQVVVSPGDCSDFDNNDGIKDYHQSRIELLDAFVYSAFELGEQSASLRIGNQAVSWGESLALFGGISSAQGPLDISKSNNPGVELKDIFMPVGQAYFETGLTESLSLGAYYQYDWQRSRVDAPGSWMSPADFVGEGVESLQIPTALATFNVPAVRDEPEEGQWGVAIRYLAEELNSTEFGFYYLNYNDTLPVFQVSAAVIPASTMAALTGNPDATAMAVPNLLTLDYFDDIDLIGASFGTVLGDTNVSGEISYRDGSPVQIDSAALGGGFHFAPAQTVQAQVSVLHLFGENAFADNLTFMGEIAYNRVQGIDATPTTTALGIDVDNINAALDNDRHGAAYFAKLTADYFSIMPALDLKVSVSLKHDFNGVSSVPYTFTEDKMDLGLGADFIYDSHAFGLKYVAFLTDPAEIVKDGEAIELGHQLADRDNVSVYYKYSF